MWEQQKPSLNQLLNYQPQEKEETFEQNEEFNEQLYKIDQMRTFYLQEWKPQKNWKQQYEKQPQAPEIRSEQYQEGQKKKLVVRGLYPKKKSASLPYLTNIALPIINSPSIQKYQKSRSTHQLQQALISQKFLRSRKFYQKQFDQRNLNKRFNQEKKLISQIQKQIQKYKMKQISRHSLQHRQNLFEKQKYVEQELDLINLKTKKICNMYSSLEYEKDKKKEHYLFSSKDLKPVMEQKQKKLSLVSLTPNPESHLKKLIRNYHNASMQHIRIPSRSKPETKKLQLKPKLQKAVLKRSTINKILKKYDQPTSLTPEKLSFLRDMQKQRKKQLVKDLILEKRKYTLHSQFQNFIAYAHPKDVSKA